MQLPKCTKAKHSETEKNVHDADDDTEHKDKSEEIVYYGERECEHGGNAASACKNKAYWKQNKLYMCGVHAKDKLHRIALPKMSKADKAAAREKEFALHQASLQKRAEANRAAGMKGTISMQRMRMMHNPVITPGLLLVFPNFRHQNRKDGFGCSDLSPMSLGPVNHGQPGLPPARNIENFHQGTKCFREEAIPGTEDPGPRYYENRLKFYMDEQPHRHKFYGEHKTNKNVPLYFLWTDKDAKEHRLSYVESRQFYCTFYERLARDIYKFWELCKKMWDGTDICICGYDAIPLAEGETIEDAYLDPTKPFGHERVLYAMLTNLNDPTHLPWRKHKTFDF